MVVEIKKVEERIYGKTKKVKIMVIETVWMMTKEMAWVKQQKVKMIATEMV